MDYVFISNGVTQLVLIPNSELDRMLLEKIVGGPVEIEFIRQPVGILGKSVKDSVIIRRKIAQNVSENEVEDLHELQSDQTDLEKSR